MRRREDGLHSANSHVSTSRDSFIRSVPKRPLRSHCHVTSIAIPEWRHALAPPDPRGSRFAPTASAASPRRILCLAWLVWACAGKALAQTGISVEGPLTVFRTGANEPLLTLSLPLGAPPTNASTALEFEFGFTTGEPVITNSFLDSFSVTLQNNDKSATALLLTADASGVQWAPPNPGGLPLSPTNIASSPVLFPNLDPSFALRFAFSVVLPLPVQMIGKSVTLFLDLFDNLNQFVSLAYIRDARLQAPTTSPAGLFLQSSAAPNGPFAEEGGTSIDRTNRVMVLPQFSPQRFFRLRSDFRTRLRQIRLEGDRVLFEYDFVSATFTVQSATAVGGPYADETNAVVDVTAQTITIPKPAVSRFYRVQAEGQVVITGLQASADRLVLKFQPRVAALQSSATPTGPYADESGVLPGAANRSLSIPRTGQSRFYRIRSDQPSRITAFGIRGGQLIFGYE